MALSASPSRPNPAPLSCQVKADRNSTRLTVLQQASRTVNEMAANVVASTRTGLENLEEKGVCVCVCVCVCVVFVGVGVCVDI